MKLLLVLNYFLIIFQLLVLIPIYIRKFKMLCKIYMILYYDSIITGFTGN